MAKNFITGAAQQVSASPQRVTDIMKLQPDISAGKPKGAPEGKVESPHVPHPKPSAEETTREAVLRCAVSWNNLLVRASPANGFFRDLAAGCFV
jgi:hypothetical protein